MTPEEYREKLIEAAVEVHKLIVTHKVVFEQMAQTFLNDFQQWRIAAVVGQQKALLRKKNMVFEARSDIARFYRPPYSRKDYAYLYRAPKELEDYDLKEIVHDLGSFYEADESLPLKQYNREKTPEERKFVYLAPPLPLNPMDTLRLRGWPVLPLDSEVADGPSEREPQDQEEDLLRKFFLLSIIHAFYSHGQQPIIDRDCLAARLVLDAYRLEDDYCVPDKQALIAIALFDVQALFEQVETGTDETKRKLAEEEKKNGDATGDRICIDMKRFTESKTGKGSKRLLDDLLDDRDRKGVTINERRHGLNQPKKLRRMLRYHDHNVQKSDYARLADKIPRPNKRVLKLDIPDEDIEVRR